MRNKYLTSYYIFCEPYSGRASMTELSGAGIEELVAKRNELEVLVQRLQGEKEALKGEVQELSEVRFRNLVRCVQNGKRIMK